MDAETAELLEALERLREVRGSLPLYDGLVRADPEAVALAASSTPHHPLRPRVEAWLAERGISLEAPVEPSEADTLKERLAESALRERALAEEVAHALAAREVALRAANAYAAISVLLAAAAILGWLAAFGVLPFTAEGPTPVPTEAEDE